MLYMYAGDGVKIQILLVPVVAVLILVVLLEVLSR